MPSAGYLRSTVAWYGGLGLLTGQVARNLALPPKYVRLVVQEIEVMGVRSAGVALIAASFTGMVLALQSGVNMARFGAETYVGPLVALSILRELGPVLTAILVGGKVASGLTAELGYPSASSSTGDWRGTTCGLPARTPGFCTGPGC